MAPTSQALQVLELPYRWAGTEGAVAVEISRNEDPLALGCAEFARGFPCCRATVEPPARGYGDALGWVQLLNHSANDRGFEIDLFTPLGDVPHPFNFFGFAPVFFDAPHTDQVENWDFLGHAFLCGIGGELFDKQRDIRAVLGFSWGFHKRGQEFEYLPLEPLAAETWDGHRDYLSRRFPAWPFASGYREDPLRP